MRVKRSTFCRMALAAAFAAMLGSGAVAEPLKIRLSYIVPVSNWATMIAQEAGARQTPRQILQPRNRAL